MEQGKSCYCHLLCEVYGGGGGNVMRHSMAKTFDCFVLEQIRASDLECEHMWRLVKQNELQLRERRGWWPSAQRSAT